VGGGIKNRRLSRLDQILQGDALDYKVKAVREEVEETEHDLSYL